MGEREDLSALMPNKTAELKSMLSMWRRDIEAQMPVKNPNYDPIKDEETRWECAHGLHRDEIEKISQLH